MKPHALFFVYVWPEPLSSAAGVRTRELMDILLGAGWEVSAVSPSGPSPHCEALVAARVRTVTCDPNVSTATDPALAALPSPALVIYDRFVMEEQFGWRARTHWPQALHLVDTQDLHSLRRAREALALAGGPLETVLSPPDFGDDLLRELASIYRADCALVVSSHERDLLLKFGYPDEALLHLPFSTAADRDPPGYGARSSFCFLGNFRHPPNLDSVRNLLQTSWPLIRARLPQAELHLYGAYPPAEISQHRGANGVFAHGPVRDHRAELRKHRALLAPLRFGAGIKGKVLEAWGCGTPVIGGALTFEGMGDAGVRAESPQEIAEAAALLDTDESAWTRAQAAGLALVRSQFTRERVERDFLGFVQRACAGLRAYRERNLTGRMLRHQSLNATKYFSRWIEAKNRS